MKVFITGGSGFLGGHVIEALRDEHEVLAMARSDRSAAIVESLGATSVRASLETLSAADLADVDVVVHGAAYVEEWGPAEHYWTINVEGTQRLLDAAKEAGVRRVVHVSTVAAVFDGLDHTGIDERHPYPADTPWPYAQSKQEAERRVLAANGPDLETIALRPCFIWGPGDTGVQPALERMAADGSFLWIGKGEAIVSTTHVSNLVAAILQALAGGTPGESYFIADDDDVSIRSFLQGLAGTRDLSLGERSLPRGMVRAMARGTEAVWSLLRLTRQPPVTVMTVDLMSISLTVRTDKARTELGWTPVIGREQALQAMR